MRVSKVLDPASNAVSYTVVGVTGVVEPAERYLRYLAETERSPNSIKAHAHDLKDWFVFLDEYGLDWQSVKLEDVGAFIRWLRRPPDMRGHHCGEATVNRKLSTVSIFYQHAARHGLDLGELITCWDRDARPGRWKPFQHHISKGTAKQRQVVKLPVTARFPRLTFQSLSDGARWAATLGEWKFEPSYSIWTTPCSIIRHLPAPEWTLSFDISERSIPTN